MSDIEDTEEVKVEFVAEDLEELSLSEEVFTFTNDLLEDETSREFTVVYKAKPN